MRKYRFTLMELLVAMGIFALLVTLMLQFFSGAQKIWIASEARNNVYADGRTAMETINELLTSLVFHVEDSSDGRSASGKSQFNGFFSLDTTSDKGAVFFMTKTPMSLPMEKNNIRFVGLTLGPSASTSDSIAKKIAAHRLYLTVFCDCDKCNPNSGTKKEKLFDACFPPYGLKTGYDNRSDVKGKLIGSSGFLTPASAKHKGVIAERVLSFTVTALDKDTQKTSTSNSNNKVPKADDITLPPMMIQISMSIMDNEDNFRKWLDMGGDASSPSNAAKDFRKLHEKNFTRMIFLGDRWAFERN